MGEFVIQNTTLASLRLDNPLDPETIDGLQATFSISRFRTVDEDAAFGIRQIVDDRCAKRSNPSSCARGRGIGRPW